MHLGETVTQSVWKIVGGGAQIVGALGVVVSIGLALEAVTERTVEADYLVLLNFLLIFVAMGLMVPLQIRLGNEVGNKEVRKLLFFQCPRRVKVSLQVLMGLGMVLFALLWFLGVSGKIPDSSMDYTSPTGALAVASFGLIAFPAAIATGRSVPRFLKTLRSNLCPNGHQMPLQGRFCPECGASKSDSNDQAGSAGYSSR